MNEHSRRKSISWGEPMNILSMQHIALASAYLCPNCNCIGNCSVRCPACASSAVLGLAGVLDRTPQDDSQLRRVQPRALAA